MIIEPNGIESCILRTARHLTDFSIVRCAPELWSKGEQNNKADLHSAPSSTGLRVRKRVITMYAAMLFSCVGMPYLAVAIST